MKTIQVLISKGKTLLAFKLIAALTRSILFMLLQPPNQSGTHIYRCEKTSQVNESVKK
jgi:hypothetical protein